MRTRRRPPGVRRDSELWWRARAAVQRSSRTGPEVRRWLDNYQKLKQAIEEADRSALFAGFTATMAESDFSRPCIIGYGSFAIQIWPKPGAVERGLEPVTPVDRQR
jgi:hypothetical protein